MKKRQKKPSALGDIIFHVVLKGEDAATFRKIESDLAKRMSGLRITRTAVVRLAISQLAEALERES